MSSKHLAIDVGAGSGRAVLGSIENDRLVLREVHRFKNEPVRNDLTIKWNIPQILSDIGHSITLLQSDFETVGVDTWAVDFGLVLPSGQLIDLPFHYRDHRTDGVMEKLFLKVPKEEIYRRTGIQFLPFNTLFQLYSLVLNDDPILKSDCKLVMIPDVLMGGLTGCKSPKCELTNASTTQCLDPIRRKWDFDLLDQLNIPTSIFPELINPGSEVGVLKGSGIKVIAPATHDTGSAIAAIPFQDQHAAWLSTGTWSIMGIETDQPIINEVSLEFGLTNEGGYSANRLSKNVMGFWLIQECQSSLAASGTRLSFSEIASLARGAKATSSYIDPDNHRFLSPIDMIASVKDYLRVSNQELPKDLGQLFRIIYESLALKYRFVFEQLQRVTENSLNCIHVVGGGSQDGFMNQLTANACQVPVIAGPVEASSIGNILVQMISSGAISDIRQARGLVQRSFPVQTFYPAENSLSEKFNNFKAQIQHTS